MPNTQETAQTASTSFSIGDALVVLTLALCAFGWAAFWLLVPDSTQAGQALIKEGGAWLLLVAAFWPACGFGWLIWKVIEKKLEINEYIEADSTTDGI